MSNLHRINWIDNQIRNHHFPNCTDIARHFEISLRQASRDIEYLRYSLNAPLEFSKEKNGYYYAGETFHIPGFLISHHEKQTLSLLAEKYKTANSQTSLEISKLFEKLSAINPAGNDLNKKLGRHEPDKIPLFDIDQTEVQYYPIIREAIHQAVKIEIDYINNDNIKSRRIIRPYKIFNQDVFVYILAYCETRNAMRLFRCSRIKKAFITDTKFDLPDPLWIENYLKAYVFNFKKPYTARIQFENNISLVMLEKVFMTKIIDETDHIYRIEFFSSAELFSALILLNREFYILSPLWLIEKLKEKFSNILKKN